MNFWRNIGIVRPYECNCAVKGNIIQGRKTGKGEISTKATELWNSIT